MVSCKNNLVKISFFTMVKTALFLHKSVTYAGNTSTVFGEKVKLWIFQMNTNQLEKKYFLNYNFAWINSDSIITYGYIPKIGLLSLFIVELCIL